MSTISLRLPNSLHKQLRELAKRDRISIKQFTATALAGKIATLMAVEYLEERARWGHREKFERALDKVSHDTESDEQDRL